MEDSPHQETTFADEVPLINFLEEDNGASNKNTQLISCSKKRKTINDLEDPDYETDVEGSEQPKEELDPIKDFAFQQNGKKPVGKEKKFIRHYYVCSKAKTDPQNPCRAAYTMDYDGKDPITDPKWNGVEHNHEPPQKKRLNTQVRKDIKQRLQMGQKGSEIHKVLVNNKDDEITNENTPSRKQIYNMAYYLKRSIMPTGDAIQNIVLKYSSFVQKMEILPSLNLVLVSSSGLVMLKEYGSTLLVDGTFELCEGKLILTTLMVLVQGIGVPVCFLLSEKKTTETYEDLFGYVKKLTGDTLSPQLILCDFEDALRNGLARVFPRTMIFGDCFHVIQDNIKWLKKNKKPELVNDLVPTLRMLWNSPTIEAFTENYKHFSVFWIKSFSQYASYFHRIWIQRYEPVSWASFGRGPDVPSGDQPLEGWHNRMQSWIAPKHDEAIDYFVKTLWEEFTYQEKIVTSPKLLADRKKELQEIQRKYKKRLTLKDYAPLASGASTSAASVPLPAAFSALLNSTATPSSPPALPAPSATSLLPASQVPSSAALASQTSMPPSPASLSGDEDENITQLNLSQLLGDVTTQQSITETEKANFFSRVVNIQAAGTCLGCKKASNKFCSLKLCQRCCAKSPAFCTVKAHREAKESTDSNPLIEELEKAMKNCTTLWIRYTKGKTPGKARPVQLLSWKRKPFLFTGKCLRENKEKTYRVDRVMECSEHPLDTIVS